MTTNNQKTKTNDFAEFDFDFADEVQVRDGGIASMAPVADSSKVSGSATVLPSQSADQANIKKENIKTSNSHVDRIMAQQLSAIQKSKEPVKKEKKIGFLGKLFGKKEVKKEDEKKEPIADIVRFAYEPDPQPEIEKVAPAVGQILATPKTSKSKSPKPKPPKPKPLLLDHETFPHEDHSLVIPPVKTPMVQEAHELSKKSEVTTSPFKKSTEPVVKPAVKDEVVDLIKTAEPVVSGNIAPKKEEEEINNLPKKQDDQKIFAPKVEKVKDDKFFKNVEKKSIFALTMEDLLRKDDSRIKANIAQKIVPEKKAERDKKIPSLVDAQKAPKKEVVKSAFALTMEDLLMQDNKKKSAQSDKKSIPEVVSSVAPQVISNPEEVLSTVSKNRFIQNDDSAKKAIEPKDDIHQKAALEKKVVTDREDSSLMYDKKDSDELHALKKVVGPAVFDKEEKVNDSQISELVRRLVHDIDIVTGLKINMIERLNGIIDSYLRDIRTGVEAKSLLKKSVEEGGMGFTADQADEVMGVVLLTHNKIHLPQKVNSTISLKTAKEVQVGQYSENIKKAPVLPEIKKIDVIPSEVKTVVDPIEKVEIKKKGSWLSKIFGGDKKKKEKVVEEHVKINEILPKKIEKIVPPSPAETKTTPLPVVKPKMVDVEKALVVERGEKDHGLPKSVSAGLKVKPTQATPKRIIGSDIQAGVVPAQAVKQGRGEKKEITSEFYRPTLTKQRKGAMSDIKTKPRIEDVRVVHPHLVGPIDELSEMTLMDFRRLGPTPEDISAKIVGKIDLINQESFAKRIVGINAWRASQPNQLYLRMARDSIMKDQDVVDLISQTKKEKKISLSLSEFMMINQLNKSFRF